MTKENYVTDLLAAWNCGDESALEKLIPIVEQELRRIAHNYMRRENSHHTLQTTALVHEAYIKLVDQHSVNWSNREHFYVISAQIMRRILLNHARDKACAKRGGGAHQVSLEIVSILTPEKRLNFSRWMNRWLAFRCLIKPILLLRCSC